MKENVRKGYKCIKLELKTELTAKNKIINTLAVHVTEIKESLG